jgi:hypothetical protein
MKTIKTKPISDLKNWEASKLLDELLEPPRVEKNYSTPQCHELASVAALLLRGTNYEEAVSRAAALWACADRKIVEMIDERRAKVPLPIFSVKKLPINRAAKEITGETRPDRAKIKLLNHIKKIIEKRHKASPADAKKIATSIGADLEKEGVTERNLQALKQHYQMLGGLKNSNMFPLM